MIEVKSKFDKNLTKPLLRLQMRKLWWLYLIFILLFVFIGVLSFVSPETDSDKSFGIFMIVFGVLFFPLVYLLSKVFQKILNNSTKSMSAETFMYFRFNENKIYQESNRGEEYKATYECSYTLLYKAYETKSHFFMYISRMQTFIIPKKDIVTGTPEELRQILYNKLGYKFKVLKIN